MTTDNMGAPQKRCYQKAMNALGDVFVHLCNANGPLPRESQQSKVSFAIQEFKKKINKLISECE
ncbi:MAG: hypothetical protein ACI4TK_17870 [Agathobacter sp.]